MFSDIEREVTPINEDEFFIIQNHRNAKFDFPVHYHPEYELNMVLNSHGKRIVGDSVERYEDHDLVMIGPNTYHAWKGDPGYTNSQVVTIQFHRDLLGQKILDKKLMTPIKTMLHKSIRGIEFSEQTQLHIRERLLKLSHTNGFDSILEFLSILYDLAISRDQHILCSTAFESKMATPQNVRIQEAINYIHSHYNEEIKLTSVAGITNMSETAFSHFFKKQTHKSFTEYLTELRIGHAAKQLVETNKNISQICFDCGFNNLANFNRLFKKKKYCPPSEFRKNRNIVTKY